MTDDFTPQQACCFGVDRRDAETREGLPVFDLHLHKGLLRGVPAGGKALFWYPDGRWTPARTTDQDLERMR